jgi:hypothetical protein
MTRFVFSIVASLAIAAAQSPAFAQDRDTREVSAYVMTEAGLARYTQATENLAAVPDTGCADSASDEMSIDDQAAQIDAAPGAAAAIRAAGMTTREYVVFSWSLLQTGLAVWGQEQSGTLPADANKANVDFYRKHRADWARLEAMKSGCDSDDDSEDDGEN